MCRIEQLRDKLYKAIEMGLKDEILNLSRKLDTEILKYIKLMSEKNDQRAKMKSESASYIRRKGMNA